MTHLRIEQNNIQENVSSAVIEKLYELAISGTLDNSSNLAGNLYTTSTYTKYANYLTEHYQELTINANNFYAWFEDPTVRNILATSVGDGTGVSETVVRSLTAFPSAMFQGNTNIVTFDEFSQFSNITQINSTTRAYFNSCTNLKSIDLSNITSISGENGYQRWNFENCTNLESIGNTSNLTYLGALAFLNCSKLKSINTANVTIYKQSCLEGCTGITNNIVLNSNITEIGNLAFDRVTKLPETINLPNLQTLGTGFMQCTSIKHVENLGVITEIGGYYANNAPFYNCTGLLDAVLPETITTIRVSCFGNCTNLRWVKILSNTVPVYDATQGNGNVIGFGWAFGENYRNNNTSDQYTGATYPIYVKDSLLSQYQAADNWKYVGSGRLRGLNQFSTDFPNG